MCLCRISMLISREKQSFLLQHIAEILLRCRCVAQVRQLSPAQLCWNVEPLDNIVRCKIPEKSPVKLCSTIYCGYLHAIPGRMLSDIVWTISPSPFGRKKSYVGAPVLTTCFCILPTGWVVSGFTTHARPLGWGGGDLPLPVLWPCMELALPLK